MVAVETVSGAWGEDSGGPSGVRVDEQRSRVTECACCAAGAAAVVKAERGWTARKCGPRIKGTGVYVAPVTKRHEQREAVLAVRGVVPVGRREAGPAPEWGRWEGISYTSPLYATSLT